MKVARNPRPKDEVAGGGQAEASNRIQEHYADRWVRESVSQSVSRPRVASISFAALKLYIFYSVFTSKGRHTFSCIFLMVGPLPFLDHFQVITKIVIINGFEPLRSRGGGLWVSKSWWFDHLKNICLSSYSSLTVVGYLLTGFKLDLSDPRRQKHNHKKIEFAKRSKNSDIKSRIKTKKNPIAL